jgi:hypothetical protein
MSASILNCFQKRTNGQVLNCAKTAGRRSYIMKKLFPN